MNTRNIHGTLTTVLLFGLAMVAAGTASAAATLNVDFESPAFSVGAIGGNCCVAGQGGWIGGSVSATTAHSGTQSLLTTTNSDKALDPSQGDYPFAGFFDIPYSTDWWVQAWVNVTPGGSGARMTVYNALGGCPLMQISGNGTPYFHSCSQDDSSHGSLGAGVLDQWVLMRMVHTTAMGQGLAMSIIDANANVILAITLSQYTGPGSGSPQYVDLSGNAYWDDVSAGFGPAPAVVPVPTAGILLFSALSSLLVRRREAA